MPDVYIQELTYESDLGNDSSQSLRALGLSPEPTRRSWCAPELDRRARRELSRPAALVVAATKRCVERSIPLHARERTPLFVACPSGPEIAVPFVEHVLAFAGDDARRLSRRVFADGAGNVLDYLRASVGNLPGHIAKHTGVRGMNACFTGAGASFMALRKAYLLLRHGVIENALVVAGESLDAAVWPADFGAALYLSNHSGRARVEVDAQVRESVPVQGAHFECCATLVSLAWAFEQAEAVPRTYSFAEIDGWGRSVGYSLTGTEAS